MLRVARHLAGLQEDVVDVVAQEHHRAHLHKAAPRHTGVMCEMQQSGDWAMEAALVSRHRNSSTPTFTNLHREIQVLEVG